MSFLFSNVIKTIKDIKLDASFNYLTNAINFKFSNPVSSDIIPFSEKDFQNTIDEIEETIKIVLDNSQSENMFTENQKKQLKTIKNKYSRI